MQVSFTQRVQLSPDVWEYYFTPERPADYSPGQYTEFYAPQSAPDPRGQSRTFSLTSLPSDATVSFVAKFVAPISPYKQTLMSMQPGDTLRMGEPMGDLILPKIPTIPLVFIAGGIGIASFAAMLKQLIATREERPVFLFYSLRSRQEQLYADLLRAYPFTHKLITIAPHRITADEIMASIPEDAFLYLSGSQRFVESLHTDLKTLGVGSERLVFDYYDGYADL